MYASSYFEQDDGANLRFFFITAKKKKIFFSLCHKKKMVCQNCTSSLQSANNLSKVTKFCLSEQKRD